MADKIKIITIFGTRPEAIKLIPLLKEFKRHEDITSLVCVTAQHREMLDQVLNLFDVKPDYDLNIMKKNQTLTDITVAALQGLMEVFEKEKPDLVLVHGDTTTSFVASLAAFYQKLKVGHVEAGLRTFNKYEPYPEEMNRRLTGALAELHFSPTSASKENLLRENVNPENIFITGNTAIDMLGNTIEDDYVFSYAPLNQIDFGGKKVITMTAHRRENLGRPLEEICMAVKRIAEKFEDVEIVYAVHLSPQVQETVNSILSGLPRVHLIPPLDIKDMHNLLKRSYLVMTDSGGLQEEVPSMGKPVLVLRNVTERPEGIEAGTLRLAGTDADVICAAAETLLTDEAEYHKMVVAKNPFGDGFASERIAQAIRFHFGLAQRPEDLC